MSCINKVFESDYKKPEACTEIYMFEAAYSPEDCKCAENKCINKNLRRKLEDKMAFETAKKIARDSECAEKGELTDKSFYNENSRTWWIDINMKPEFRKDNCNPACVIYDDRSVEINWRCTGLVVP